MKKGLSLTEMAAEIERQANNKHDYIAPTNQLTMKVPIVDDILEQVDLEGTEKALRAATATMEMGMAPAPVISFRTNGDDTDFKVGSYAHRHIGTQAGIPWQYYDKMLAEAPHLLAENVNHWMRLRPNTERRMVRTLDDRIRALLSDRYRPLDNYDLADAILPILLKEFNMAVESCNITERSLYLKAFRTDLEREVEGSKEVGDLVRAGICISNSEIGAGSLAIQPMIMRLACTNGQISMDHSMRKTHAGRSQAKGGVEVAHELLRDETKKQADKAFWMSVQDLTRETLDGKVFEAQVKAIEAVVGNKIEGHPEAAVEVTANRFALNEGEKGNVLRHLIDNGDLSQWGLANALTRTSQDVEDYDRATEFERFGGQVIELPKRDWENISTAKTEAA